MKIAVISDIHGNFKALEAVLDDCANENVDKIVSLGDVATLGPQPRHILKKLRVLKIDCIQGNHDEALFDIENLEKYRIPTILKPTMIWCKELLNNEELDFIKSFKKTIEISLDDNRNMIFYHGTADSNIEGFLPSMSDSEIISNIKDEKYSFLIGGHTHIQMDRKVKNLRIISVGSVGCPFIETPEFGEEPELINKAQYAIIELNNNVNVHLKSIEYDLEGYIKILQESSLPSKEWWLSQIKT